MHTFYFPNGDKLVCKCLAQASAIEALSPLGTIMDCGGGTVLQARGNYGYVDMDRDLALHTIAEYENKAAARLRREAVARAASGVAYCVEARGKVRA